MGYLVFSHTQMGSSGFCTNIGGRSTKTNEIVQIRLRVDPNDSLRYDHFDSRANDFRNQLRPGSVLDIKEFYPVTKPRITHPEDLIIKPSEVTLLDEDLTSTLHEYAEEMAFDDLDSLFPNICNDNGSYYCPGGVKNPRSVGYVRTQSVDFSVDGFGNRRGQVVDGQNNSFSAKVIGVDLLNKIGCVGESLVRLSLAGPWSNSGKWSRTAHPERCFLMLSHVIEL